MNPSGTRAISTITRHPWITGISAVHVMAWTVYGLDAGSILAFPYLLWMLFAGSVVFLVDSRVRLSTEVLVLLSVAGFFHLAGGNVIIGDVFLYEYTWWGLVGYDHLIHILGFGYGGTGRLGGHFPDAARFRRQGGGGGDLLGRPRGGDRD